MVRRFRQTSLYLVWGKWREYAASYLYLMWGKWKTTLHWMWRIGLERIGVQDEAMKLDLMKISSVEEFHPGVVIGNSLTLLVSAALFSYPHFAHIGEAWMLSLRAGGGVLLGLALLSLLISRCGTIWDTLPPWQRWLALPGIWGWAAALLVILSIFLIRFLDSLDFDFGGSDSSGKKKKR